MQKRKRHQMVGFLYSHIRPQRQLLKEDRQVIPILESLSSDYQPKAKDGGTPRVVTIKRFIFYIPSGLKFYRFRLSENKN